MSKIKELLRLKFDCHLPKGMYALRGTNYQVINLADLTDSTAWLTMATFAAAEGSFGISQGVAGTTYSALSTLLNTSGVDDWHMKVIVGDWLYWKDTVNGINRMIAPATFETANIASRSPHISTLNKRISTVIATQRQLAKQPYSISEIGAINSARLDVITNPCLAETISVCVPAGIPARYKARTMTLTPE